MRYPTTNFQKRTSRLLLLIIFFNILFCLNLTAPPEARAQSRPIVITADQPNVWTLEQAHYLLAQMHRRNLDLRATPLNDLDANAIHGNRLDVLRTFLDINASFNQAAGFDNKLAARNKEFNAERHQQLLRQRDELNRQNLALVQDIARLESQLRRSEGADKEQLNAEIDEKKAVQAMVKEQITQVDNELKTLNASAPGSFTSTAPTTSFDPNKLPSGALDEALKNAIKNLDNSPQLNASMQLENYLQIQYEILAKQLTLLRDEVGPGERLLFLEIPQSINTVRGKADKKWAQTWFKIAGYTAKSEPAPAATPKTEQMIQNQSKTFSEAARNIYSPQTTSVSTLDCEAPPCDVYNNLDTLRKINGYGTLTNRAVRVIDLVPRQSSFNVNDVKLRTNASGFGFVASFLFGFGSSLKFQRQREQFSQFVQQELYSSGFGKGSREFGWTFTPMPGASRLLPGTRTTYAIVVIPKNATSLILETSSCYFPRSKYQPINFNNTQEQKWVEKSPENDDDDLMCTQKKAFAVQIPHGGSGTTFDVNKIEYKSVAPNERVMVTITGRNFPTQIGVIVGGKSLIQSIGLAQPLIDDDSDVRQRIRNDFDAGSDGIYGEFERLSDRQITFWFKMPKDYKGGTPPVSIVAPGEAKLLNYNNKIEVVANGVEPSEVSPDDPKTEGIDPIYTIMLASAPYMFGERLKDSQNSLEINGVDVYRKSDTEVIIIVRGRNLSGMGGRNPKLLINGELFATSVADPKGLHWLHNYVASSKDEFIQVTIVSEGALLQPAKVKNPLFKPPSGAKPEPTEDATKLLVKKVSPYDLKPGGDGQPLQLTVELDGIGFVENMTTSHGKYTFESAGKAYLTLEDPPPSVKVKLTDEKNNLFTTVTIRRKDFMPRQ